MRFEARFVNGNWVVFDTHRYCASRSCGTKKEAEDRAAEAETRVANSRGRR